MSRLLKCIATVLGAICYLFGAGGVIALVLSPKEIGLKALMLASLYPIGVWCFYYISGSKNWRTVVPIGVFFPFYLGGVFILLALLIDKTLTLGAKDAPFLAAIPTILIACLSVRYVKAKYFNCGA